MTNQSDCGGPPAAAVARGTNRMVKVSQYLVRPDDIPRYGPIRSKWLGNHRPASMLAVIPGLVRPDFLIKIEAWAAAPYDAKGAKDWPALPDKIDRDQQLLPQDKYSI